MRRLASAVLACLAAASPVRAQELQPKAYSAAPVGANFLVTSFSWSTGGVVFDPTLPVSDVHADVQGLVIGVGHTFNLFGDLALANVAIPVAWAEVTGKVMEQSAEVMRSGLADLRVKLSVNLIGNPAMTPREFARAPQRTIVGVSVDIAAPSGQYYPTKLINLGANRWSVKPEIGLSWPRGRWDVDAYAGVTLFETNPDFFPGGRTRTQDPVVALQGHLSYAWQPRLWVAVDGTWYHGGTTQVDDGSPTAPLSNSRLGATLSLPIGSRYSLKVAYSSGVVVRTGTNFNTVAIAWQALWLSPRWSGR